MNESAMSIAKVIVGGIAASTVFPEVVMHVTDPEDLVLGIPLSVFYVSLAGTMIGFLILPDEEITRASHCKATTFWHRAQKFITRWGMVLVFVLAWALLSGWLVMAIGHFFISGFDASKLPLAGLSGATIRVLFPRYLSMVKRKTDQIGEQE